MTSVHLFTLAFAAPLSVEDLVFPAATASPSQRTWIDPDVLLTIQKKGTPMRPFCAIGTARHFCALASASSFSSWLSRSCNAAKRELNSPTLKNVTLLAGASRVLP